MNIYFISLGCDKNLVDSEAMLGLLRDNGYSITDSETDADIAIINTCCFIHDAKEESIEAIIETAQLKKTAKLKLLVITGCLAQRYKEEILTEISEVDIVLGTTAIDDIVKAINTHTSEFKDINYLPIIDSDRVITTNGYTSYIKIAEGCSKHCSYCIIPSLRGSYRSVPFERLIDEAKYLASVGTKELIVVAQETTIYGTDLYKRNRLPELLHEFCKIDGIEWVRLLYCYPEEITDELINTIKTEEKICNYIDMPIQHSSDSILKRMGRRTNKAELKSIINRLRSNIPDIVIRTTLITGFPGETEGDFNELLDFVYDTSFERLGVFTYSPEEGTRAALMPEQIDIESSSMRRDAVMEMQQDIVFDRNTSLIGKKFKVLIEGFIPDDNIYVGRTYMDAPNIDGLIFVESESSLLSGDIIDATVIGADGYDLISKEI